MAVYTKINEKDIVSINDQFEMEKITHFKGIKKGDGQNGSVSDPDIIISLRSKN